VEVASVRDRAVVSDGSREVQLPSEVANVAGGRRLTKAWGQTGEHTLTKVFHLLLQEEEFDKQVVAHW
jgi:hypothetical protein